MNIKINRIIEQNKKLFYNTLTFMNPDFNKKKLDFGCGPNKIKSALGIDMIRLTGLDIVANFFELPYP